MECGGEGEGARGSVAVGGEEIGCEAAGGRRRAAGMVVEPGLLRVRCPAGASREPAVAALGRREGGAAKSRRPPERGGGRPKAARVTHFLYRGRRREVVVTDGPPSFGLKGGKFLVSETRGKGRNERIIRAYRAWMMARAEKSLPRRAVALGDKHGIWPRRVTVRQQSTRWGSATSRGALSLNAMILVLPPRLADYVILHELCHLAYANHSPEYWEMLGSVYPDVEWAKRELKKYADDV